MTATPPARAQRRVPLLHDDQGRIDLKSLSQAELREWFADELGEGAGRAQRVYKWLWQRNARTFHEMTTVPKTLRARLADVAYISVLEPELELRSGDGTVKYLWRLEDGHTIESVLIPDGDRLTLCMSSQVGCAMACTFCLTGDLGLLRHLKPSEIANQPLQVGHQLPEGTRITNLVLMGMGEPLHNLRPPDAPPSRSCLDDHALNFSATARSPSRPWGWSPAMKPARRCAAGQPRGVAQRHHRGSSAARSCRSTKRYSLAELMEAAAGPSPARPASASRSST